MTLLKFICLFLFTFFLQNKLPDAPVLDRSEGRKAFELLNNIRQNPKDYSKQCHYSPSKIKARPMLLWNDTLAKVAEQKAMDMASRNYFAHVDPDGHGINFLIAKTGYTLNPEWLKNKKENFFESIGGNYESGEAGIIGLIIDKDVPSFGHRNHLLGVNDWNKSLTECGIAFVRSNKKSKLTTYMCVVIAKHNW